MEIFFIVFMIFFGLRNFCLENKINNKDFKIKFLESELFVKNIIINDYRHREEFRKKLPELFKR